MCAWSWKEDWNTCEGALTLLEGVIQVNWVELCTSVPAGVPFYERWDNTELLEVFHPFLVKRKAHLSPSCNVATKHDEASLPGALLSSEWVFGCQKWIIPVLPASMTHSAVWREIQYAYYGDNCFPTRTLCGLCACMVRLPGSSLSF